MTYISKSWEISLACTNNMQHQRWCSPHCLNKHTLLWPVKWCSHIHWTIFTYIDLSVIECETLLSSLKGIKSYMFEPEDYEDSKLQAQYVQVAYNKSLFRHAMILHCKHRWWSLNFLSWCWPLQLPCLSIYL